MVLLDYLTVIDINCSGLFSGTDSFTHSRPGHFQTKLGNVILRSEACSAERVLASARQNSLH